MYRTNIGICKVRLYPIFSSCSLSLTHTCCNVQVYFMWYFDHLYQPSLPCPNYLIIFHLLTHSTTSQSTPPVFFSTPQLPYNSFLTSFLFSHLLFLDNSHFHCSVLMFLSLISTYTFVYLTLMCLHSPLFIILSLISPSIVLLFFFFPHLLHYHCIYSRSTLFFFFFRFYTTSHPTIILSSFFSSFPTPIAFHILVFCKHEVFFQRFLQFLLRFCKQHCNICMNNNIPLSSSTRHFIPFHSVSHPILSLNDFNFASHTHITKSY